MNKTFSPKLVCALYTLFVLGNATIFIPAKLNGGGVILGLILSLAAGLIMLLDFKNFDLTAFFTKRAGKIVAVFLCLFALICAIDSATDFSLVSNKKILEGENFFLFSLIFSLLLFLILKSKKQVVFKISFIFLVLIIFSQLVLFLLSANQFKFEGLKSLSFSGTFSGGFFFFSKAFAPTLLLTLLFENKKSIPKGAGLGMLFGFLLILLPLLQILLIFGFPYSDSLDFAFLSVLDTVSIGLKFSRLEGLAYIIFFFGALTKCSVCLMAAKEILTAFYKPLGQHLPLALSLIIFTTTLLGRWLTNFSLAIQGIISLSAIVFTLFTVLLKSHTHCRCKTK